MGVSAQSARVEQAAPARPQRPERSRRIGLTLAAGGIVLLSALLHVARLGTVPGWDAQEGYNLDIAWNLTHGHLRLFALTSAFAQHPPLFYLQLGVAIHLFGYSIVAVRALASFYAVLTGIALLAVGRRLLGAGPALWAGAIYAAAPIMLANTRWGYTYAQLAFVGLLCLWASWRYHETRAWRWLLIAAALAGLAAFSDYEGAGWALFVALLAARSGWRPALTALAVALAIPLVGLGVCFVVSPSVFAADFGATILRAAGGNLILQFIELLINYFRFVTLDAWVILGIVGCFLAPPRVRWFLFAALTTVGLVVLKARALGPSVHTIVPLLPLLALGGGLALHLALRRLYAWTLEGTTRLQRARRWGDIPWLARLSALTRRYGSRRRATPIAGRAATTQPDGPRLPRFVASLVVFLALVSPLGIAVASDLSGSIPTRQDTVLATPADAETTIRYVLTHAHSGDLVLASPALAWRFDHPGDAPDLQGADLLQTVAQAGDAAAFYPAGLPSTRWVYTVALDQARYVVVDDLLRQLAMPGQTDALVPLMARIRQWPVVFTAGQYTVYARPAAVAGG